MATGSLVGHTPSAAMLGAERERRQVVGDYYMEERHLYGAPAVSWWYLGDQRRDAHKLQVSYILKTFAVLHYFRHRCCAV